MKQFLLMILTVSTFALHADALFLCSDDQTHCAQVATGVQPAALFNTASLQSLPMDCGGSCKAECRIEFNDCVRGGSSKSECAALRAICESHCHN